MARTVQDVITRVRELLQDDNGIRYTDLQVCAHLIDALDQARSVRPDLFVDGYEIPLPDAVVPADPFPLPRQFFAATTMYIAGACELRDDEFAVDGRAMTLRELLTKKLTTGI